MPSGLCGRWAGQAGDCSGLGCDGGSDLCHSAPGARIITPIERQGELDKRTTELSALNERLRNEIEARQRSESALLENEARLRATFENAAVGIAHVAPDARWLLANTVLCDITGSSRAELLPRTLRDVTHPEDLQNDWDGARRLLAAQQDTSSIEERYIRKDAQHASSRNGSPPGSE